MRQVVVVLALALALTACSLDLDGSDYNSVHHGDARIPPDPRCLTALGVQAYPARWRFIQTLVWDTACPIELRIPVELLVSGIGDDGYILETSDGALEVDPVLRVPRVLYPGCAEHDRFEVTDRALVGGVEVPVRLTWELTVTDAAGGQSISGWFSGNGPGTCNFSGDISGAYQYSDL